MGLTVTSRAKLRICGRCSWIFEAGTDCPKCGFCSYGARYVLGDSCYRLKVSQRKWFEYQMSLRARQLLDEIAESNKGRPLFLIEPGEDIARSTVRIKERSTGRVLGELSFGKAEATLRLVKDTEPNSA